MSFKRMCSLCGWPGTNKLSCPWNPHNPKYGIPSDKHGPRKLTEQERATLNKQMTQQKEAKTQKQQARQALEQIKFMEQSLGQLVVHTNIPDHRISGYYVYNPQAGYWYNRTKDVYLYCQESVNRHVAANLAKTGRFTPTQLAHYKLFSFAKHPFDTLANRLAFMETMSAEGFSRIDDIVTPVGTAMINGEAFGVPKAAVMKYGFRFA